MRRLLAAFALPLALAICLAPGLALALDGGQSATPTNGKAKLTTQMLPTDPSKDQWVKLGAVPKTYFDSGQYYSYSWRWPNSDYIQFEQDYYRDSSAVAGSSTLYCECSEPPTIIDAGSTVTLQTRLYARNVSGYGQYLEYKVELRESGLDRSDLNVWSNGHSFLDSSGEYRFQIGTSDYSAQTHTLSKTFPKAGEGPSEMSIYLYTSGGGVCEWKYLLVKATKTSLAGAKVTLVKAKAAYTGKTIKPTVKSVVVDGKTLKAGTDYTVSVKSGKKVGSYKATVTGKGSYEGKATATFKIVKATNKLAKAKVTKTLKAKSLKKKVATIALPKPKFGKATWKVSKNTAKKVLSLTKAGKVQVAKGAKAGTYVIKLKANVKGTANYKVLKNKVVTVKVTVK